MAHRPGDGNPLQYQQPPYSQQWPAQQPQESGGRQYAPQDQPRQPAQRAPVPYQQQPYPQQQGFGQYPVPQQGPVYDITAAARFWYILSCIALGAGYFAKIPAKKAMADFGMARLTGAEAFWYILMCIPFGAGYFAKVPVAKALSELQQFRN